VKNLRLKGGFGQVSCNVLRDPDLTLKDKGLYAYLSTYADSVENQLTVSVNKIAAECGTTPSTVKRSIEVLKSKGIIRRVRSGRNTPVKTILLK